MLTPEQKRRYARNTLIDVIGERGQEKLLSSRVLVVGAGGLGSPVCFYLAAAGVGTLGILDSDRVEISNLQRQIVHTTLDVGLPKAESASRRVSALNPDVRIIPIMIRLTEKNVDEIIKGYDVVVGALDNLHTRYVLNDACVRHSIPMVEAGVVRFDGLMMTIVPGVGPCYRCLFPEEPEEGAIPGTDTLGILGAVPGAVGSLQSLEVVKILTGIGRPLAGRVLLFDGLNMAFREIRLERDPQCPVCSK